jgi:glycosyltransferase involved in cell wall biosynthesis
VEILVRDDGSNDDTTALLHKYATTCKNVTVVFGTHVGFVRSFFTLLEIASPTADYLALCDQDDVWREDRISRAVARLSQCPSETATLYCLRLVVVDENLQPLKYSEIPRRGLSFRNALVENQVPGCTILLNQATRRLLTPIPSACVSHDWWIYLVVSALGTIVYDEEPSILYRQHAANVFGVPAGKLDMWKGKIRQFLRDGKRKCIVRQAEEFRRMYGAVLSDEHRKVIERFLASRKRLGDRLRYALSCGVYRQSPRDHCLLKARIAFDLL